MATVRSYKQICTLLEDIATRHPNINTFKEGEYSDFGEDGSIIYPAMKVNIVPEQSSMPVNDYSEYPSLILAVNIQMLDQLLPAEENRIDTKSDMIHLLQDVINELTSHPYYMRSNVKLLNDINFEKYYRVSDDNNTGIGAILFFQLVNDNSWCGLPFEDITGFSANGPVSTGYSQSTSFLKCSTLTACTQFQDYVEIYGGGGAQNYYTTGATLIGTEAVFDRNDQLSAYTLQLSGLTSGITATGAYLNLSGGTVTGATTIQANLTVTGITESGYFKVTTFNPTNPQIYCDADTNTGLMFDGPDIMSLHTGGFQRLLINSSGQITNGSQLAGTGWETYLSGDTRLDNLSAATLSATTILSAGTNIGNIFIQSATTNTLSNKRITKRIVDVSNSATPTLNTDNADIARLTGLTQAVTSFSTNLTGNPVHGDMFCYEITDNGTGRALSWGASFAAGGTLTLPTTTVASTLLKVLFEWDSAANVWRITAWA